MDAIATMTSTIQRISAQQTPEERVRAKRRRYYERNREAVIEWMRLYRRLSSLREVGQQLKALESETSWQATI